MGRRGVAFVALVAAVISAASLTYAVFWAYQDAPVARDASLMPAQPAAPSSAAPPVMAPTAATRSAPQSAEAPRASASPAVAPPADEAAAPLKSAAKPPNARRDVRAMPSPTSVARTPAASPAPQLSGHDAAVGPPPEEPPRDAAPAASLPVAPAPAERTESRRVGSARIVTVPPPAAAPAPPIEPAAPPSAPGPFAALPAHTDTPTIGIAPAPVIRRSLLRHAARRRVATLRPQVPMSRPAAQEARPITVLRGGPSIRVAPTLPDASAVALAAPPVLRVIRPRPLDPRLGPPGPLILRVQD